MKITTPKLPRKPFTKNKLGFSLLEIVVGVYIFGLLMLAASGAIVAILRNQRTSLQDQEVIDSVRGAQEIMNKAIRISSNYAVPAPTFTGNSSIQIAHPAKTGISDCPASPPCLVNYYLASYGGIGTLYEQNELASTGIPLTSENVNVRRLEFNLVGSGTGDTEQVHVMIYMEISAISGPSANKIIPIQSTITQRTLDIP